MTPLFRLLPPEAAHRAAIRLLALSPVRRSPPPVPVRACGIRAPNPVGLAPGFDKHGEAIAGALGLGFGFVEIGGVTPRPQRGNPKPRLFRLARDRAVINRMGFNSHGAAALARRLERYRERGGTGVVGVNLAVNGDCTDPAGDYGAVARAIGSAADFATVNVSSPNTPGLRDLQAEDSLRRIVEHVRSVLSPGTALWVKLAPDLDREECGKLGPLLAALPADAVVVGNTTVSRPDGLRSGRRGELGGLSGRPLGPLALRALRDIREASGGEVDLVAAGGIGTADDVRERFAAGASLVQIYSALVFAGSGLPRRIVSDLAPSPGAGRA